MNAILFYFYILVGRVIPMHEQHEGRDVYVLRFKDHTAVEYCYKEEILEYIETGTFEYNEDYE